MLLHEALVVERIWEHYKRVGEWPLFRPLLAALDREFDIDLDELTRRKGSLLHVVANDRVALAPPTIMTLPDVQPALAHLPAIIHEMLARFIASAAVPSELGPNAQLSMQEMSALIGSAEHALLLGRVLDWAGVGPLTASAVMADRTSYAFHSGIEVLRYEGVKTLADIQTVRSSTCSYTWVRGCLEGELLEFVRCVFAHVREHGRWPLAAAFAIEQRRRWFVPHVIPALLMRFVCDDFNQRRYGEIRLTPACIPYLQLTDDEWTDLVSIAPAMYTFFRDRPPHTLVTITELATHLKRPRSAMLPLCLLLEQEPWIGNSSPINEHNAEWAVVVNDRILKFKRVASWEAYIHASAAAGSDAFRRELSFIDRQPEAKTAQPAEDFDELEDSESWASDDTDVVSPELAGETPKLNDLLKTVLSVLPGPEGADDFEQAIADLLTALFRPDLDEPEVQVRLHQGRKRVDLVFRNVASEGFFKWVGQHYPAAKVFVECKNYNEDPANPELDQLTGRFSPKRGRVGLLVCRTIADRERMSARCRDAANDEHGYVIVLDDQDLHTLVDASDDNRFDLLRQRFDALIM